MKRIHVTIDFLIEKILDAIIVLALLSLLYFMISPFLPTAKQWPGSFPYQWMGVWDFCAIILRNLALLSEKVTALHILSYLAYILLIFLLVDAKRVFKSSKDEKNDEERERRALNAYLRWSIGGLLTTILFLTKGITIENATAITWSVLGLSASTLMLLVLFLLIRRSKRVTSEA